MIDLVKLDNIQYCVEKFKRIRKNGIFSEGLTWIIFFIRGKQSKIEIMK